MNTINDVEMSDLTKSDPNTVLKNTYRLLAMTLTFSAVSSMVTMAMGLSHITALIMMIASFVVLFVVHKKADKASGIAWIFVFTGLLGGAMGPTISHYLNSPDGISIVVQALTGTAIVFFGLSAYAVKSKKDFSFMGGFLMTALIVAIIAMIANIFLNIEMLSIIISSVVILIMSAFILYDTSAIVRGEETNYILATVSMYLNIYNIFIHLLSLLGMSDD